MEINLNNFQAVNEASLEIAKIQNRILKEILEGDFGCWAC